MIFLALLFVSQYIVCAYMGSGRNARVLSLCKKNAGELILFIINE